MKIKNISRNQRLTMMVRSDLTERVKKLAPEIEQNPNHFVNLCVEGCLNAMEGEDIGYQIPLVTLHRRVNRKPLLDSRCIIMLCTLFAPPSENITLHHFRFLSELLNEHEGPLTRSVMRYYWKRAIEMNAHRLQIERELVKWESPTFLPKKIVSPMRRRIE